MINLASSSGNQSRSGFRSKWTKSSEEASYEVPIRAISPEEAIAFMSKVASNSRNKDFTAHKVGTNEPDSTVSQDKDTEN